MGNENLQVEIEYAIKDGSTELLNIPIDEYYAEPGENEVLEYDSVPKYLEQYEYTNKNFEDLDWSILRIHDRIQNVKLCCEEKYWGDKNRHRMLNVSLYINNELDSWEQTIEISENKAETIHVLKLSNSKQGNAGGLISHTIIEGIGENENVVIEKSN